MNTITATYSPEDNKLRLYASERLDAETYAKVKAAGFIWAPKQELFVAPAWSPQREDLCIELAGEIEAEGTTLAERAQAKAGRLEALAEKRANQAGAFERAARAIGERFANGQPILIGHHSERRARKDQERMHNAMRQAVKAAESVNYWHYKARGAECHANYKNQPRVIANRIKTLLADLRTFQRQLNDAHANVKLWEKIVAQKDSPKFREMVLHFGGMRTNDGAMSASWDDWSACDTGKMEPMEMAERGLEANLHVLESPRRGRWIQHTLNRLAYERSQLGEVARYEGELRPTLLQMFARENGADKPTATKTEAGYRLECAAPLPAHIGEGCKIELTEDGWRDLMQSCGYVVVAKESKPAKPPLLNVDAAVMLGQPMRSNAPEQYPVVKMTQAEYMAVNKDYRGVRLALGGQFRFRSMMKFTNPGARLVAVFLTDAKAHPAPAGVIMEAAA